MVKKSRGCRLINYMTFLYFDNNIVNVGRSVDVGDSK